MSLRLLPRRYWVLLAVLGVFNLANLSDSLLILEAKETGLSFVSVILVYALFNACYSVLSLPAGAVSDRVPRRVVYAIGLLAFAITYIGLGLTRSSGWVWALFAIYGAYWAFTDGVAEPGSPICCQLSWLAQDSASTRPSSAGASWWRVCGQDLPGTGTDAFP